MRVPASPSIDALSCRLPGAGDLGTGAWRSLVTVLESVFGLRAKCGVRHSFAVILLISVCAVLSGGRSVAAIAESGADTSRARLGEFRPDRRRMDQRPGRRSGCRYRTPDPVFFGVKEHCEPDPAGS